MMRGGDELQGLHGHSTGKFVLWKGRRSSPPAIAARPRDFNCNDGEQRQSTEQTSCTSDIQCNDTVHRLGSKNKRGRAHSPTSWLLGQTLGHLFRREFAEG